MFVCYFEQNGPFGIAVCGQQTGCWQYKQQGVKVFIKHLFVHGLFNDAVSRSEYIV